jgi:AraC-binding-like domain
LPTTASPSARPLSRYPVMSTTDLDAARDAVTRVYLPHDLLPGEGSRGDELGMVLNAIEDKNFTLGFLTYGADTQLDMPATRTCYHVNLTTAGETRAEREDGSRAITTSRASGLVLHPDQRNRVRWTPDAEQLILKVPRPALEGHLAELLGRPVSSVIEFDFQFALSGPRGQVLLESVEFLARELERPGGLAEMPLPREQLEAFVLTQLLMSARHPYTDELNSPAQPTQLGRLKPVVEYLECNADMPLTPVELARVGCMSVRTLHASFQ